MRSCAQRRSRKAHSYGVGIYVLLMLTLIGIDSSNIIDDPQSTELRESISSLMLMDLLIVSYVCFKDIKRFRLISAILFVTVNMVAELWLRHGLNALNILTTAHKRHDAELPEHDQ